LHAFVKSQLEGKNVQVVETNELVFWMLDFKCQKIVKRWTKAKQGLTIVTTMQYTVPLLLFNLYHDYFNLAGPTRLSFYANFNFYLSLLLMSLLVFFYEN